jgi:DNA-binding Lrp family transcriptional regulator
MGVFFMVVKTNSTYLLISCNIGKLDEVMKHLGHLDDIKEIQGTFGPYDIIAKVESLSRQHLQKFIVQRIRTLIGIKSALTLECKL